MNWTNFWLFLIVLVLYGIGNEINKLNNKDKE